MTKSFKEIMEKNPDIEFVIHVQNEEIARLHELKDHLESRITFLLEQIERKDRRMDKKDEIIDERDKTIKEKDELLKKLTEKLL